MSCHTQESSFLSQTEPCIHSRDIVELGCKLVKELELESNNDTLGRWMAHHLAELLKRAEKASGKEKDALQRECADLIIRLWTCRTSLPTAHRPLQSFESIMKAIECLRGDTPAYFRDFRDKQNKRCYRSR